MSIEATPSVETTAPVTLDPWVHRSAKMRCATCMFYVPKVTFEKERRAPEDGLVPTLKNVTTITNLGRCRRHAPTMSGYPAVFATDWCGDHKLDEKKA